MADDDGGEHARDDGHDHGHDPRVVERQPLHIHAVEAEYDGGDGQYQRQHRQRTHSQVQVVADDAAERLHRAVQDVAVDVAHLGGLADLDEHVFQQVLVLFVHFHQASGLDACQHGLVRFQRGGEVHQRTLEAQHLDKLLVAHGGVKQALVLRKLAMDAAQVHQVLLRDVQQHLQQQARALPRVDVLQPVLRDVLHRAVAVQTQRDHQLVLRQHDERQRLRIVLHDGLVHHVALVLHGGAVDDDHHLAGVVVVVRVGALLLVQCGADELGHDAQLRAEPFLLVRGGSHDVDPASLLGRIHMRRALHTGFEEFDHTASRLVRRFYPLCSTA